MQNRFTQINNHSTVSFSCTKLLEVVTNLTIRPGRTPKSAMAILGALMNHGPMCPLEISEKLDMAPRTVSFALRKLLGRQLLKRIPNLNDMRRPKYHVNMEVAKNILQQYNDSAITTPFSMQKSI